MIFLSDFQKVDNLQNKRSTSIPRLNSSPIGQTFYIFSSSMEGLIFNTSYTASIEGSPDPEWKDYSVDHG